MLQIRKGAQKNVYKMIKYIVYSFQKQMDHLDYRIKQQLSQLKSIQQKYSLNLTITSTHVAIISQYPMPTMPTHSKLMHEMKSSISFTILLFHDHYPFEPPVLLCTTNFTCPRWDDGRNFITHVLGEEWWPSVTLKEIILKIGEFVLTIPTLSPSKVGKRTFYSPILLPILKQYCKGMHLTHAYEFSKQDSLFGQYHKIILGISWYDLTIYELNKKNPQEVHLKRSIPLLSIADILSIEGQKVDEESEHEIAIMLKNKKKVSLLFKEEKRQMDQSQIWQNWNKICQNSLRFLHMVKKHLEIRAFLKNESNTFDAKISKISSILESLVDFNDDTLLFYYRIKLQTTIGENFGLD